MAVQTSYPGVYIEEFAPGAPIQGVGTSTAAFIGVALQGELEVPTELSSWDEFTSTFGDLPVPGFYLWHAVQGFFQNGGQTCYIVRASNGAYATVTLPDSSAAGNDLLTVRARSPGNPVTPISVTVAAAHLLQSATTSLYQPTGTLAGAPAGRDITLGSVAQAAQFRPGDAITAGAGGATATLVRVSGTGLRLDHPLAGGPYAAGDTVRLADAPAGTRTVRIISTVAVPSGTLVPGSMLTVDDGTNQSTQFVESVQTEYVSAAVVTYRVVFRQGLAFSLSMDPANPATVESEEFTLTVAQGASTSYLNLSIDSAHPRYVLRIVNNDATGLVRVSLVDPPPPVAPPLDLPLAGGPMALAGGADEDLTTLASADFLRALDTLVAINDVNLVACPDCLVETAAISATTVQQGLIVHCEQMADRFAILDAIPALAPFGGTSIESQRVALDSTRGYAALYYPWLRVPPLGPGDPILVPPSGHVCGIIARSDNTRGVHKAPANELVNGALGVERRLSDVEQGQLNLQGINVLRVFATGGRVNLWGARTTATDTNWQYINVRRLFLYLEESIEVGIRSSVFEPNNLQLWGKLKRTIGDFLRRAWRDGALFGATQEEAFYVRIDEVLNPFSEQALGRLHIEIGVRPSYPAEFIVVRIGIWDGGQQVSEG